MDTASELGVWYPGHHLPHRRDHGAVVLDPAGTAMTYGELDDAANRFASLLRQNGLQVGDHVCLWLDNELCYPALWWGAVYAGLFYTPISSRLTAGEAAYLVRDSGSRIVVVGERLFAEQGARLVDELDGAARIVVADNSKDGLEALLAASSPEPFADRVEGAPMLYSSGTTGHPKAVSRPLSGAPLGTTPGAVSLASLLFELDENAVYLSPAPLYHAAPNGFVSATLALGATAVVMEHFDPLAFLAAIERYGVTHTQVVPTMFVRLLALAEVDRRRFDLSTLRFAIHAAAPCPVPVKHQMMDWWGPIIHEYYSGTEGVGFTYCSPADWLAHPGSVGRSMLGAVHIVDDDGQELPPYVAGGVYFEGGAPFEYHGDREKTAGSYLANGWSTFGDIGHVDSEGFLYLTDRKAHVVIVGGVNVYPQEAENALIGHPAVLDAAVFGVPHPEWGEEVVAVVQLIDQAAAGDELARQLLEHLRGQLASIKCPRRIDFRATLPREPNGKLLKRLLRDEYVASSGARQELELSDVAL